MKRKLLLGLLLAPFIVFAQSDFIMAAGSTRILTPAERTLNLKKLSLGDNATIIIPVEMNGWTVTANDVTIGNNVRILSSGKNSTYGSAGVGAASAMACTKGMTGGAGTNGSAGVAGKTISLNLKIRSIGLLTIQSDGMKGGTGGGGGSGGKGGDATCNCNAGAGGTGGKGGNGGNGGDGGNVTIIYSKVGGAVVSDANFKVINEGGQKGAGGPGGNGGAGGAGGGCRDPKALVRANGANGTPGAAGQDGLMGKKGTVTITLR